jgi:hypothetical protein
MSSLSTMKLAAQFSLKVCTPRFVRMHHTGSWLAGAAEANHSSVDPTD